MITILKLPKGLGIKWRSKMKTEIELLIEHLKKEKFNLELKLPLYDFSFLEIKSLLAYFIFEGIISPRIFNEQYFIEKI